jgi:hypothetical protein
MDAQFRASSADEHRIYAEYVGHIVQRIRTILFLRAQYILLLRMVEYPDLFVGHPDSLYALFWARQTNRGLLVTLEIASGHGHMYGHSSLEPLSSFMEL